jgi:glycosyltransferase involved in cell wall biosynthesis
VRKHLRLLCQQFSLRGEGYEVHALLGERGEPGLVEELEDWRRRGVHVTRVPSFCRALNPWRDARAFSFLKRRLRALAPDIVHTHCAKAGFLGRLAAHACRVPRIIHTPHVFPFQWAAGPAGCLFLRLERFAARRCHVIVCVSKVEREEALRRRVAGEELLVVVRNGVSAAEPVSAGARAALRAGLGLPEGTSIVAVVGRLAPQKGVDVFLHAAARVLQQVRDILFVVVGSGPLEAQVRAVAAQLNLGQAHLRFMGHVEAAEKVPYALLEAMAAGVPIVATNVIGSNEAIVDGASGLLARAGDAADVAEKLLILLLNAPLRATLAAAARERVEKLFSLEQFYAGHRRLYAAAFQPAQFR